MGLAVLAALVALIVLVGGLFAILVLAPGPPASTYEAALDDLDAPFSWEVAQTTTKAPGTLTGCIRFMDQFCPSVTRYYLVAGEGTVAFGEVKRMLTDAGFQIDREFDPWCDAPPSAPLCSVYASRADVFISVNVNRPGGSDDGLGFAEPDRFVVRMTARRHSPPATSGTAP